MIVPIPGGAYVNVAHISLISAVQKAPNNPGAHMIRILLMGSHEHDVVGHEDTIKQLHTRLKNALDELDAPRAS